MEVAPWGGSEFLWLEMADRALREGHSVAVSLSEPCSKHPLVAGLRLCGARIFPRPPRTAFRARARRRVGRAIGLAHSLGSTFQPVFATRPDCILLSQGDVFDILCFAD